MRYILIIKYIVIIKYILILYNFKKLISFIINYLKMDMLDIFKK